MSYGNNKAYAANVNLPKVPFLPEYANKNGDRLNERKGKSLRLAKLYYLQAERLEGAKAEAMEFVVQPGAKILGNPLRKIDFPSQSLIGMVVRDGNAMIPDGNMVLQPNDRAVIFTLPGKSKTLSGLFQA